MTNKEYLPEGIVKGFELAEASYIDLFILEVKLNQKDLSEEDRINILELYDKVTRQIDVVVDYTVSYLERTNNK